MPSAVAITLRTVITSTEDVPEASGVGYKRRTTENDFNHTLDTTSYATQLTAISSEIYSRIAGLTGTVSFIQGSVRIVNSTAAATPAGYSSDVGKYASTPVGSGGDNNEAVRLEADSFRTSFSFGPGDYSSAATLKTILQAQIAACIALTPSYT